MLCSGSSRRTYDGLRFVLPSPSFCLNTLLTSSTTVLGKAEGTGPEWHGHVTAITVAPEYRRLSLARKMMSLLEMVSEEIYKGFFVDLYVRCNNVVAIDMYEKMGYSVYRRVREYYGSLGIGKGGKDEEDAFGQYLIFCKPVHILN
jgi:ribosomal protein S18 acetylase RimI-like enzyme